MKDYLGDDAFPDDAWPASTPEQEAMDVGTLNVGLDHVEASGLALHTLLIIRNGRRVVERHGLDGHGLDGHGLDGGRQVTLADAHHLMSTTKTVTSALVGIAISEGLIPSVATPVMNYFADDGIENPSPAKASMTIEDVLTMRSGLTYAEGDPENGALWEAESMAAAYLSRPMTGEPGVDWNYSTADSQILAEILRRVTGKTPLEHARDRLFDPLGVRVPRWDSDPSGTQHGGTDLHLTPRDLARFGWMLLEGGRWRGAQVVPEEWIRVATRQHAIAKWGYTPGDAYGYHCWIPRFGGFATRGYLGRHMFVLPERRLLAVITGELYPPEEADAQLDDFVERFVLAAVRDA
jgi:CubicO group peptidase (beta-lactamase class C family)